MKNSSGGCAANIDINMDPRLIEAFERDWVQKFISEQEYNHWRQNYLFDALKSVPVMVIRGETSDLLSEATVGEMLARHPRCSSFMALNEAHAPLLGRERTGASIFKFIESV